MNSGGNNFFGNPMPNDGGAMLGGNNAGSSVSRETTYQRGNRGNYMMGQQNPASSSNSSNFSNSQSRPLDMPNLQTLGINPQGPNPPQNLGMGLNLNSLPMNTAILAAALNQFGLLGNQLNPEQVIN